VTPDGSRKKNRGTKKKRSTRTTGARSVRPSPLSRREREMMDIIYAKGRASAGEVREGMGDPPSYSAVRATLRVLVEKGHLQHQRDGAKYIYKPTVPPSRARETALRHVMQTFFDGSARNLVAALVDLDKSDLSDAEIRKLESLIEKARRSEEESDA